MKKLNMLIALSLISALGLAQANNDKDDVNPNEAKNRKIVVFQSGTSDDAKRASVESVGGQLRKYLGLLNAAAVHLPEGAASSLAANPNVLRVDDDLLVEAIGPKDLVVENEAKGKPGDGSTTPPPQETPWGISRVKAPESWLSSQGAGVNVCVVDTGIDLDHPDLAANVKGNVNAINPLKTGNDDNGHGTHVAGTIAALNNTIGVVGVAPQVNLLAVKVLSRSGFGWLSDIIEGLDWCVKNGGKVANMSLGSSSDNQSFHDAISATVASGVTVVAAAGNSGPCTNCVGYPAKYPEVVAVSASNSSDQFASFSSQGPEVDLIAPGVSVRSTYKGGGYATASGTSMATPHVSGAAALKLALNPSLTPADLANALKANADPLVGLTSDQQGAGLINSQKLVTSVP